MFLPGSALSRRTASMTSSRIRVELRQAVADSRVVDTTYLRMSFSVSANESPAIGSKAAPWICQVRRPSSRASHSDIASKKWAPMSSCQYGIVQPPWVKPPSVSSSAAPGAWMTPSTVMNSATMSFRMPLPSFDVVIRLRLRRRDRLPAGWRRLDSGQPDRKRPVPERRAAFHLRRAMPARRSGQARIDIVPAPRV